MRGKGRHTALALLLIASALPGRAQTADRGAAWPRRIIDNSSRGADGVRMADVNGDGRLDITTGWEEGGVVRAYLHPAAATVRYPWPAVTVGNPGNLEDAVFVDLDGDGAMDVVSSAEGTTRGLFVHWAPKNPADYLNPARWQTDEFPQAVGSMWMFAAPMDVDGINGIDLVAGGKGTGATIAWFRSPSRNRRDLSAWGMYAISDVGWTMSLIPRDMDFDGDMDLVVTDRFDDAGLSGARWWANPGTCATDPQAAWENHLIGAHGYEPMLADMADLDGDGLEDLIVPIFNGGPWFYRRIQHLPDSWELYPIACPPNVGTAKGVGVGDIDLDGRPDIVMTFAGASPPRSGVVWMSYVSSPFDPVWVDHEISGPEGQKFDIVGLIDMDGDGDLDVVTTEEQADGVGLGLIWYENPTRGSLDTDLDGVPDDGDGSGVAGDHPCRGGNSFGCDDNCPLTANPDQADGEGDGFGDTCDACPDTGQLGEVNAQGCPLRVIGDSDADGDVDQEDFGRLQLCFTGLGNPQLDAHCAFALLDGDIDVDANDITVFMACFGPPAAPPKPSCLR